MGYIYGSGGMGAFPELSSITPIGTDGDQNFDVDLDKALDGDAATFAKVTAKTALTEHAILKVDLGDKYLIGQIRAKTAVWANNDFATAAEVTIDCDVSEDGTNWTQIDTFNDAATLKNSTDTEVQDTFEVSSDVYIAQYIRIDILMSGGTAGTDNEARVYELFVAGLPLTQEPVI